jgi:hypothetical protein
LNPDLYGLFLQVLLVHRRPSQWGIFDVLKGPGFLKRSPQMTHLTT